MRLAVLTLFLVWPIHLVAQESNEDRGFLTGLLERSPWWRGANCPDLWLHWSV